jgi:NADPH:quinone reductase
LIALGAKVIAAAGSDEKLEVVKKYGGADFTLNYIKPGWQKDVLKLTNGKGVDVIYDPVGMIKGEVVFKVSYVTRFADPKFLVDCLKCIAWKGRALVIGFAAGEIEKVITSPTRGI